MKELWWEISFYQFDSVSAEKHFGMMDWSDNVYWSDIVYCLYCHLFPFCLDTILSVLQYWLALPETRETLFFPYERTFKDGCRMMDQLKCDGKRTSSGMEKKIVFFN